MTNRKSPMRRHSRFPVSWPVLYGSGEFLAEGTVLDLTSRGWRVAGSMPVVPGMQLTLQVLVPDKSTPLRVQRATVLWVTDDDFAIEVHEMSPDDEAWVAEFLRQKLGLMWMSRQADHRTSYPTREETFSGEAEPSAPCIEDVLQRFLAIQTPVIDIPTEARWNSDLDVQENEGHTAYERLPEKTWREAHRILRSMLAMRADRERTGRDPIADN